MVEQLSSGAPRRWSAQRKAQVVNAVSQGALSLEEACEAYELTPEEFRSWQETLQMHGVAGLRICAPERRNNSRRSVQEPAVAVLNGHSRVRCCIKDISERGARLKFSSETALPKAFVLECTRTKRSTWVSLVWRQDRLVGLRFDSPPPVDSAVEPVSGAWLLGNE